MQYTKQRHKQFCRPVAVIDGCTVQSAVVWIIHATLQQSSAHKFLAQTAKKAYAK